MAGAASPAGQLPVPASDQPGRRRNQAAARAALQAAIDLLDAHGYRGLTMSAVARRAGVGKATLYRWWPDKAHLAVDAYRSKSARDTQAPATGDLAQDLKDHLGRLAYALVHLGSAGPVVEFAAEALADAGFRAVYQSSLLRERRQALLDIFDRARDAGQVRAGVDANIALDAALGAVQHRLLFTGQPLDGPFVSGLAELLVRAVGA